MRILLDTNAYTAMVEGHEKVCALVRMSEQVIVSMVVVGELLAGFRHSSRFEVNSRMLDDFLRGPYVQAVPVSRTTADRFGRVWAGLKAKAKPIPTNDMWIAAHAMETGTDLLSFDKHFDEVDGLAWIRLS
ncbi:MAG: type II toxin-antitoxin system VapC family toxin [bacterium]|nr:type II toxin-antitoxin system VapC family toxin [bacterium]